MSERDAPPIRVENKHTAVPSVHTRARVYICVYIQGEPRTNTRGNSENDDATGVPHARQTSTAMPS